MKKNVCYCHIPKHMLRLNIFKLVFQQMPVVIISIDLFMILIIILKF